jgi:hypothetical protein
MEDFFMAADTNRLRSDQDGLFTHVEHTVLASWFGQQPPIDAARIKLDDALAQLGFGEDCRPYSQAAAAAARVLLERTGFRFGPVGRATN